MAEASTPGTAGVERDGTHLRLTGPVTLATVPGLHEACFAAVAAAGLEVDLAAATVVDSSALALLIALRRAVEHAGGAFTVRAVPDALRTLAGLYGVEFLIDNAAPDA